MFDPLLAMGLGVGAEGATAMVVKGLAVGGGFLVGYALGAAVAWALDRWLFAHKAPPQVKKAVALLAGVAVAVVLAMILFGEGGNGLFGRGGDAGKEKGTAPDDGKKNSEPPKEVPREKAPPKKEAPRPTPGDIHITILGGKEVNEGANHEGRFYLVEANSEPKTLTQLKEFVAQRREVNAKAEPILIFRFRDIPLRLEQPAMKKLIAWLQEAKILYRFE
jgi:hypothetical protein